jgi:hypothetical protein
MNIFKITSKKKDNFLHLYVSGSGMKIENIYMGKTFRCNKCGALHWSTDKEDSWFDWFKTVHVKRFLRYFRRLERGK